MTSKDFATSTMNDSSDSSPPQPSIPPRSYRPYQTSSLLLEAPLFHRVLEPFCLNALQPLLALLYKIRWALAHPLRTPLVPLFCRFRLWNEWTPRLVNLTVGELLLYVPLTIWFLLGYHYSYVNISTEDSGYMATYCIYFCFLTANKSNSLLSFVFGIPFERMIPLHMVCAVVAVVVGCFHTHVAYTYGAADSDHASFGSDPNWFKFLIDGETNLSGACLLYFLMASTALSLFPIIRRLCFQLWLVSHIVFGLGVLVTLLLHNVSSAAFVTAWWALDMLTRYLIMASCQNKTKATLRRIGNASRESHEPAVEISFAKDSMTGFDYRPGQFVQIAIPKLSIFEFHPISISSAPHEDQVTLHVRALGDWTQRLVELAETTEQVEIWIEGPYGALMVDLQDDQRYRMALFVSGGIGVTPCQSIGKDLLHQHYSAGRNLQSVKFVWTVRDASMVDDIPPLGGLDDYSTRNSSFQRFVEKRYHKSAQNQTSANQQDGEDDRRPALVQVDIYQTRDSEVDKEKGSLPYNVFAGRPDLDAILQDMKQQALEMGETNVAVFGCGPASLMSDLQEACRRHSSAVVGCGDELVFFDLHIETFEL